MKAIVVLSGCILIAGCEKSASSPASSVGHGEHSHGKPNGAADKHGQNHSPATAPKLHVTTAGAVRVGEPVEITLTIPGPDGQPIRDFVPNHDAKVHLILIREGLDQFAHLHPEIDAANGAMKVKHTFPTAGVYHLFADHQAPGGSMATAIATLTVTGDAAKATPMAVNAPGTIEADGLKAKVGISNATAGEKLITFELINPDGSPVADLEPYMGARGHLVVVSADASRYVHAHPSETPTAKNVVAFAAHFPQPGLYKGWGQFKRAGTVRIVPFIVNVE